jgi:hypothetical protein
MTDDDELRRDLDAARRYVQRYGSHADAYRGVRYDQGGLVGVHPVNLLTKPEPVLTPEQVAQLGKRPPE